MALKPTHSSQPAERHASISIERAPLGERIRKVVSRSNHRITGKFASRKNNCQVHWESQLERDAFILHEADPSVLAYREQAAKLSFPWEDRLTTHVPDLLVKTSTGLIFREIKSEADAEDPFIRDRAQYLSKALPLYGYQYQLLTEQEIRRRPRLDNAELLVRYSRFPVPQADLESALATVEKHEGQVAWADIEHGCFGDYSIATACQLILAGALHLNLAQTLTPGSTVSRAHQPRG